VADYRVYCLGADGRIKSGEFLAAASDAEAIDAVRQQDQKTDCELWLSDKKLATIRAGGGEPILHKIGIKEDGARTSQNVGRPIDPAKRAS
jgi:hypothetical protein